MQVLEVGIGSFPNALYMGSQDAPQNMDIIGVDPNASRRSESCYVVLVPTNDSESPGDAKESRR